MNNERGFTLIELLVSLAILSIALAVLFGSVSSALDRTRKSRNEALAASLVQSLMTRASTEALPAGGETSGSYSNGFLWQVRATPYGKTADSDAWKATAFVLRATVSWRDGTLNHTKTLTTLRVVPTPPRLP